MSYEQRIHADGPFLATLCVLFHGDEPPGAQIVLQRLGARFDASSAENLDLSEEEDAGLAWRRALTVQDYPYPVMLSARRGLPDPAPELFSERRRWWEPKALEALGAAGCHLAVQSILHPDNAQAAYGFLLQAAALAAGPGFAGLWDAESGALRCVEEVYDITASKAPPSVRELFGVVAAPLENAGDGEGRVRVATRGLLRCLQPDIQFAGARPGQVDGASELLAAVAGQWVVSPVPEPGQPFGLMGSPADLIWRLASEEPGAALASPTPHSGLILPASAGAMPPGTIGAPEAARLADELMNVLAMGGLSSVSPYESRIVETQARERLGHLKLLWEYGEDEDLDFMVKIGFDVDAEPARPGDEDEGEAPAASPSSAPPRKEYLWFAVRDLQDDAFLCELASEPVAIAGMEPGAVEWRSGEGVADWTVRRGALRVGPGRMLAVRGLLRELRGN